MYVQCISAQADLLRCCAARQTVVATVTGTPYQVGRLIALRTGLSPSAQPSPPRLTFSSVSSGPVSSRANRSCA